LTKPKAPSSRFWRNVRETSFFIGLANIGKNQVERLDFVEKIFDIFRCILDGV
jgi:hypothetical protein